MTSKFSSANPSGSIDRVAAVARRILSMLRQPLADRRRRRARLVLRQIGVHAGRRRRHRQAEDVVQQPFAAQHRRRPIGIRRRRQQRALRQQPAALIVVGQRDPPETAAVDPGNAVVPRQPFVDERVVGVQEIDDAAILADGAADKQLGFPLEGLQQAEVVVRDSAPDRRRLLRPGADSTTGRRNRRRAPRWRAGRPASAAPPARESPDRQLSALGQRQQPFVGNAAPQEERQPRGDFHAGASTQSAAHLPPGC